MSEGRVRIVGTAWGRCPGCVWFVHFEQLVASVRELCLQLCSLGAGSQAPLPA
jgi:hypothetical protein